MRQKVSADRVTRFMNEKIERGHNTDLKDIREMIDRGLIEPRRLLELFARVEDKLYKYPAIDPQSLRHAVERLVTGS